MKLKRLFAMELGVAATAAVVVLLVVQVTPYLASSKPNSAIDMYTSREFAANTASITRGRTTWSDFNYSSFDPAILVIDLTFENVATPGELAVYCNLKKASSLNVQVGTTNARLNIITFSGADWLEVSAEADWLGVSSGTSRFSNVITFSSSQFTGFEGNFSYRISIRGSR